MKLRFYSQNCFVIETGGLKILTDPWFHPAFFTWYPYPMNRRFRSLLLCEQESLDYLYVSHAHFDHFDETFLKDLRKDIKVICPDYGDKTMQKKYAALGFNHLCENLSGYLNDNVRFELLLDQSREDSALFLEESDDGVTTSFLNLNDCFIENDRLPRNVTYLASQFSGAIHYPHSYDFPTEVKLKKIRELQQITARHCFEVVKYVNPSWFIPSAGPSRFLDPALAELNNSETSVFYDFDYVRAEYRAVCSVPLLEMNPGDVYENGRLTPGSEEEDWDIPLWSERLREEWSAYDRERQDYNEQDIEAYFARLKANNLAFIEVFPRRFKLVVPGRETTQAYIIVLDSATDYVISPSPETESFNYTITLPPPLLRKILYDGWNWDNVLSTFKAALHRNEDYYDQALFLLLTWGEYPEVISTRLKRFLGNVEMIRRDRFAYQRFCPHSGQDLTDAEIDGNVLTCPRHRWQWDLTTGRCLRGSNTPLRVGSCR